MFKKILLFIFLIFSLNANDKFIVLCYHNIEDNPKDSDIMSITTDKFIQQLNWLSNHGYTPISIDDLIAAKNGEKKLPPKAVLLTFDDAYRKFYSRVYPILKAFKYPAVLAVVGKWMESKSNEKFLYGDKMKKRDLLLSWEEIKEMSDSGLVEIASHSYDLHHGVLANPQGNMEPAATTRIYNPKTKKYEDDESYFKRIEKDLKKSSDLIYQKIGKRPRVIVWPYGEYNKFTIKIAKRFGMKITFTLDDGSNNLDDLPAVKRILLYGNDSLNDFIWQVKNPDKKRIQRVVHIDLDYIYDDDPIQQEKNLGILLDRIKEYKISTVYLQAFADPDGDGVADALYFPNRHLPMRADLFNRVSWQLYTRCGVERIYAWMPVLAFDIKENKKLFVKAYDEKKRSSYIDKNAYKRLSPFNEKSRKIIKEIYEDLAKFTPIQGILFHDDAYFSDFEDANEEALNVYKSNGFPKSIEKIKEDKFLLKKWTSFKTDFLIDFTKEIENVVREYRPNIKTARNIYAQVVLNPKSEEWFAQNFEKFLYAYDYTAIMAMPYMEKAKNPKKWFELLIEKVKKYPIGLKKSVFELQSVDWRRNKKIDSKILANQMKLLQKNGVLNFGYYPDDFIKNHPDKKIIHSVISLNRYPFIRR
ncbi:poly-beta-1,6-N-acetyl-D-glucosamine N-deacetylase PgaB [Nitrosophilus kaiyonis]|uniref:poly-beta-1,6-N-acetyl-D-glucosamine N-deacetylase PgaB n=1 Tax=Nitrosophilus kaiyonis TaxID=2930200 RepID=UPI002490498C|nr:poly-beta-1,6-N-acetyl-D-glucosamine N-deacetylase PgaB [Nitrosophilus kaiyonis]